MADLKIEEQVLNSFKGICSEKEVTLDSNIKELGLDSLDVVEMLTDMEDTYHIEFDNDEMLSLSTVRDVATVLEKKLKK